MSNKERISPEELIEAWERMVLIRESERLIAAGSKNGDFRTPIHLGIGQESVAVLVAKSLSQGDLVFGNHRSHAHYLALGGSSKKLFAEILGRESGCSGGRGGSMHITAPEVGFVGSMPIVAGTIPVAAGAALQLRNSGSNSIAVAYFGDGATEEGVFHETLNIASIMDLPILFVCENNLFSSHLHIEERQPSKSISRFAEAHKVKSIQIDSSDFIDNKLAIASLVNEVRYGKPAFLEVLTYRWMGHVGPEEDLEIGKNRRSDLSEWHRKDAIAKLSSHLSDAGILSTFQQDEASTKIKKTLISEYEEAKHSTFPTDLYRFELK